MRIALDPVPLVLGIYAYVGSLLGQAAKEHQGGDPEALGRRYGRQRESAADREVQKLVRGLHSGLKTADKLLKKTGDVWKISQETDLVELVLGSRGDIEDPPSYVLLRPPELKPLLTAIASACRGTGESADTIAELEAAAGSFDDARPRDYLLFGFAPWQG
ncbi:MAG TPA: hypothetical protein VF039_14675 [Longimicrobiales bacterium]